MKKYFSNHELFHILKSNKRLLLFLLEENLMTMDDSVVNKIVHNYEFIKRKYPQYFQPEIQPFIKEKWFPKYDKDDRKLRNNKWVEDLKKEIPSNFYEKRKICKSEDGICKFIQKDLIEEFIIYLNKNCYFVNSTINQSIYETNNFILKKVNEIFSKGISLIEYSIK